MKQFEPSEFGVDFDKRTFIAEVVKVFNQCVFAEVWTVDELLLHPREAIRFCDMVRDRRKWYEVPDDVILRSLLQRRKHPEPGLDPV